MGKKSKNNSKKCKNKTTSTGIQTNNVSADGRMAEKHGRRLYDLLAFLAEIAVPLLESRREDAQKMNYRPIGWKTFDPRNRAMGMSANPLPVREAVMSFILKEIEWLVEEVESGRHNDLFFDLFGRSITESDRNEIKSWRLHIQDDFVYVTSRKYEGAVLVQAGNLHVGKYGKDFEELHEQDFHEPRVFIVQGLADSIKSMVSNTLVQDFKKEFPAIAMEHPDATLAMINTTLLPYNGGITYMTIIRPHTRFYYKTPKDVAEVAKVALNAVEFAFDEDSSVALYRKLNFESDSHICRLACNQNSIPSELQLDFLNNSDPTDDTRIMVKQMFWRPYQNENDPRRFEVIKRIREGPPLLFEGLKNIMGQEYMVGDRDVCPFHNEKIRGIEPHFKDCCKREYLRRALKASKTHNAAYLWIMYEPVEPEEIELIERKASQNPHQPLDLMKYLRLGYNDIGMVQLKIPTSYVELVKKRMDRAPIFHAVMEYRWNYFGYIPVELPQMGIMTFGDLDLFADTGIFQGKALTARRLGRLIQEMKYICQDIPILDAMIEMQPSHKMKPDEEALKRNQKLLQDGLNLQVSQGINKCENEGLNKICAYCGDSEKDGAKLSRCPCKLVYFCSKEHQRAHWPNHKKKCQAARAKMSNSNNPP